MSYKISGDIKLNSPFILTGDISTDTVRISGDISTTDMHISGDIQIGEYSAPSYTGEYEVTPILSNDIILDTNGKVMQDNVSVKKIPYYETSNLSGGTTVYIAMGV